MIAGIFHQGSGLGNQLFRYITVRSLALDKGYEWGMYYQGDGSGKEEGFKGESFMNIDKGKPVVMVGNFNSFTEKKVVENGIDIRGYDPEINFIEDNTVIDGEFQDMRYWGYHLSEINEWLKVEPIDVPDDVCVIGFRGGEYTLYPDLFLTEEYWQKGIKLMREINPKMKFEVHTDDVATASRFFPDCQITHDIGVNWRSMRYAKHALIANSSFFIFPRLLNGGVTISPRGWARRNVGVWALPQNYYPQFFYI